MRLEKISAAGRKIYYINVWYEEIMQEGNVFKKISTPYLYNNTDHDYPNPFNEFTINKSNAEETYPWYEFRLNQTSDLDLLKSIFPDLQENGSKYYIDKPFRFENSGGEVISTNLKIDSLRLNSVILNTVDELIVGHSTKKTVGHLTTTSTIYKPIKALDNFPGYDINKSLSENFNSGVFDDYFTVSKESLEVSYTKELQEKTTWKDGAKTVTYSPYAILKPSIGGGLRSVRFNFRISSIDNLEISKTEEKYRDGLPASNYIIY